jgi:hypothetical protein
MVEKVSNRRKKTEGFFVGKGVGLCGKRWGALWQRGYSKKSDTIVPYRCDEY